MLLGTKALVVYRQKGQPLQWTERLEVSDSPVAVDRKARHPSGQKGLKCPTAQWTERPDIPVDRKARH